MPEKLAIDLEYVRTRSAWGDLRLALRTLGHIVGR
jgi:lipopolysaccharide/colanic/teichoic acid biosynthesis glycosyltransferase